MHKAPSTSASRRRPLAAPTARRGLGAAHPRRDGYHRGFVRRAALIRRLVEAPDAMLAVIVAPPGYGKSSLLCEWAEQDKRAFVWLSVDGLETSGLEATVRSAAGAAKKGGSFVLVLDDAHLASSALLGELLRVVMTLVPAGSMVALSSRSEPPLRLGRLRASQALVELRAEDLAMLPAEAAILLRRTGLELDFTDVQSLVRRTEGWPVGLYLAALSVREQADAADAVSQVRGDEYRLAEYFRDEVLSTLSEPLAEFAIQTSVLEELSGPVCDAILQSQGSAGTLTRLEHANPLLRPLDRAHERYRWHGLFRDALSAELRRTAPELVCALHARASSWYEACGDMDHAIDHAVSAHDSVRTGDLLWASIVMYLTHGRNEIVQGWLCRFGHDELTSYAPLALAAAYSYLAAGDTAEAHRWGVAAAAAAHRGSSPCGPRSLAAGLARLDAILGRGGVGGMRKAAARACALESDDSPWRPICLFLRGTALHLAGERTDAKRHLEEAADLSAASQPSVTLLCLAQAAMIAIEQQDWETAAELTDRSGDLIEQRGLAGNPIAALAFAASAATRAHHGRADEAKHDLRAGIELLTVLGDVIPWYGAETRILLAHASLWLADVVGARTLLAEASRLGRKTSGAVVFEHWFDEAWSYMDTLAETRMAGPSSLTIAELRILRFMPSHRSFREIAAQLGVSTNTVKTQAHAVYRKLGAASRSEAVSRASEAGLLGQ